MIFVRERVIVGKLRIAVTPTQEQIVDIMTKALVGHKFVDYNKKILMFIQCSLRDCATMREF